MIITVVIVTSIIRFLDILTNGAMRTVAFLPFDLSDLVEKIMHLCFNVTLLFTMISHSFEGLLYYMIDKNMQSVFKTYMRKFNCK